MLEYIIVLLTTMVFNCCVPECNASGYEPNISLHKFPKDDSKELKVWKERIRRSGSSCAKDDFIVTASTRICSLHFNKTDFINFEAKHRRLRSDAVPSVFAWSKSKYRKSPKKRYDHSETDSASEGEDRVHVEVQADLSLPCAHQFSMETITSNPKLKLFKFYTGFSNYEIFTSVLELLVPNQDRSGIIYWDRRATKSYTCGLEHFDSGDNLESDDNEEDGDIIGQPFSSHKLSLEDVFLLTPMKLKLGLFYKDLAMRFNISLSTVTKIFKTWINLMYVRLGSMKIFSHRDTIMKHYDS